MEQGTDASKDPDRSLKRVERACIEHVLHEECGGRVIDAARLLGVAQKTVYNRLHKYEASGVYRAAWPDWVLKAVSSPVVGVDATIELPGLSVMYGLTPEGWLAGVTPRPLSEVPIPGNRIMFAAIVGSEKAVRHMFSCGQSLPWFFHEPVASAVRVMLAPAPVASFSQVRTFDNFATATCCLFHVTD